MLQYNLNMKSPAPADFPDETKDEKGESLRNTKIYFTESDSMWNLKKFS